MTIERESCIYLPMLTEQIENLCPTETLKKKRNNPPMKLQH